MLGAKPWPGEFDVFHEPPLLRTKLADGTRLLASYSHSATVYDGQAMVCPSQLFRRPTTVWHGIA